VVPQRPALEALRHSFTHIPRKLTLRRHFPSVRAGRYCRRSGKVEFAILGRVHEGGPLRLREHKSRSRPVLAVAYSDACVKEGDFDTVVAAVSVAATGLLPDSTVEMVREQSQAPPFKYVIVSWELSRTEQTLDHLDGHAMVERQGAQSLELLPVLGNLMRLLFVQVSRKSFKIDNIQMGGFLKLQKRS